MSHMALELLLQLELLAHDLLHTIAYLLHLYQQLITPELCLNQTQIIAQDLTLPLQEVR
jgi:hypothetical protein